MHFRAGVDAGNAGRWNDALLEFARAYEIVPQPQTLYNLARAQRETGRFMAAIESYQRFLHEATNPSLETYRANATDALAQLQARLGHVRLRVEQLAPGDGLSIDGQPVTASEAAAELALDPGQHLVIVARAGSEVWRASFALSEGEVREVPLRIVQTTERALPRNDPSRMHEHPLLVPPRQRLNRRDEGGRGRAAHGISPWVWVGVGILVAVAAAGVTAVAVFDNSAAPPGGYTLGTIGVH
jgi:hypothetical protein